MAWSSKYTYEIWDKLGNMLVDFSGRASGRKIVESRNHPEAIEFTLDLNEFERFCRDSRIDSKQLLITNSTEIRVRRLGTYLAGGQLYYKDPQVTAESQTLALRAQGYLALFSKRFTGQTPAGLVSEVHTGTTSKSRKDLAWYLINASQQLAGGDFGVTRGVAGGSSTKYDKTYGRTNIMEALQSMTEFKTAPIDFEFTYDKVFNTYETMGSNRPDIVFEYPGNIREFGVPEDGSDVANEVVALGQGGADGSQKPAYAVDSASQADYQLRQSVVQSNGTDDSSGGITEAAKSELAAKMRPNTVLSLSINANLPPYVTDYKIGDRVTVKIGGYPTVNHVSGTYRIEKRTISIDDNDSETVTLEVVRWE